MIVVHIYCSYKLSPSGFQYGAFEYAPNENKEFYYLSDKQKLLFVSSIFDYGIVRYVRGRLPDKKTYIFLFKKLSHVYDDKHEEVGKDVAMNMAFEFDNFSEFCSFAQSFSMAEKQDIKKLSQELADCIQPDFTIEKYKLSINKKRIDKFIQDKIRNKIAQGKIDLMRQIEITTISDQTDYRDMLLDIYNFPAQDEFGNPCIFVRKTDDKSCYYYPGKKKPLTGLRLSGEVKTPVWKNTKLFLVLIGLFLLASIFTVILMMIN